MYVYEEIINNQKLTEIINTLHENVKYLPGHKLPENVASISSILILFVSYWLHVRKIKLNFFKFLFIL